MTKNHWKGAAVPEAGDPLIPAFSAFADTIGVIQPTASIAAMRAAIESAAVAGNSPTATHPAFFDLNGIIYRATGERSSTGTLRVAPVNEVEHFVGEYTRVGETEITRPPGGQFGMIEANLPVRPYDRLVLAWGMANARVNGVMALAVLIMNQGGIAARWENNASNQTSSTFNMGLVPAGKDPRVILALQAGSYPGLAASTAYLSSASNAHRLAVAAFPVAMS